jgi:predicted aspartyl protease
VIVPFDPQRGLIIVPVEIVGPSATALLRLAVDTGATGTLVNTALLVTLGYDPALASERIQITTGSGIEFAPRLPVRQLTALAHVRKDFPVLCHTLPPSAGVDGLLGLDFLRGKILTIDFGAGDITLS